MAGIIGTPIQEDDLTYAANADVNRQRMRVIDAVANTVRMGGGTKAVSRHHAKGKLTARERIDALIDPDSFFLEVGLFAAEGMYEDEGGCPGAGVVAGVGVIAHRECMIVAGDATVKAGAWFPMTAKKNLRAQEIAIDNNLPIIYLVDSAGVYLPLQEHVFPDKEHFGRQFRNNAVLSSKGIPQIAAIMGPCVAGGAYLPIMCDEVIIVNGTGSVFLAGPALVEAAIGEKTPVEPLGGAMMHTTISGVTDTMVDSDQEALERIRSIVETFSPTKGQKNIFSRAEPKPPTYDPAEIWGILPSDRSKPYSMRQILARLLDESKFDEYKEDYGKTIICGIGRIDGWAVGIVANNREVVRNGKGEMQVGGVIYSDSADKAARFVMNCNQRGIPLLFMQDVTGFMVGTRAEQGGIIKDGAKFVNAVANSIVPKFTIVVGNSYGAGNYAMCGRAYDPRFMYAWPTAQIAVMGGAQAAKTLLSIKIAALAKRGESITEAQQKEMLAEIQARYDATTTPVYAAANMWVDGIIAPTETRSVISRAIAVASHGNLPSTFSTGVLQV
ncbi:MAG: acyl-CoA carboxylase subunit beta [Flavobacteriales bacterium]|nr:MAG: acyl-CoA carboxylase subunit beta [Bacteroidota bacterium]MBE2265546.1 acyl-CoA carboxylase subunit beta [Flavobacteriales bacterium]MBV6463242.1 putative propionyl-CoA carboxylase beta chain 5 [Chlorobiota bacterium]MBZ0195429.1 acyl-CoA carboxylase subunit beta [Candidatus Kapabacteria bacterium]MCC6331446.1 acyl-CoA carboxylase subunit beta [Ignavibacteria bacterium]